MKVYNRRWPLVVSFFIAACSSGLVAEEAAETAGSAVIARQREKDEQLYKKQDALIAEARELRQQEKFDESIAKFEEVLAELELLSNEVDSYKAQTRYNEFDRELRLVYRDRASWLLAGARTAFADGRYDDGIRLANRVANDQNISKELRNDGEKLKRYGEELVANAKLENDISSGIDQQYPNLKQQEQEIKELLEEAQVFYDAKRYSEALGKVEQVYLRNPFNMDALALAGNIYRQFYTYGFYRHKADVEGMFAFNIWQWAEPMFVVDTREKIEEGEVKTVGRQTMMAKLDKIIFPQFEFSAADIQTVIDYLNSRNKAYDPDKEGVNINIGITPEQADRIKITMSLSDISLGSLIRYICLATGLKYRVSENGVHIAPNINDMDTRTFPARRNVVDAIMRDSAENGGASEAMPDMMGGMGMGMDPGMGGGAGFTGADAGGMTQRGGGDIGGGGSSDGAGALSALAGGATHDVKLSSSMLKGFFQRHGVRFDPGSSIIHDTDNQLFRVRNTPRDLSWMGDLIRQMEAALDKPLIMVEIKSIEISDTDLQELGFDWSFDGVGSNMNMNSLDLNTGATSGWGFKMGNNSKPGGYLAPLRTGNTGVNSTIINDFNIFPALFGSQHPFGSDSALNISLTVNALSRSTRSETLSAPKLLTSDNVEAWVDMVKSYYFPDSWDEAEVEVDTGDGDVSTVTITPPVPDFGDETDIGITFHVTPRVLEGNQTIELQINPKITSYVGNDEYSVNIYGEDRYMSQSVVDGVVQNEYKSTPANYYFTIWRPIISERSMTVTVHVNDGETLVLGGMVENETKTQIDKFPILGELPLIGRFFQSQSENAVRRNLLIFVTARLVGFDGQPIKSNNHLGSPDFKR